MHHEKAKVLVRQKWDPETGNKNYWLESVEAEKLGSLSQIVFLVSGNSLSPMSEDNILLSEETVMTSFVIQGEV